MLTAKELLLAVGQKITASVRGENFDVFIRGWREGEYIIIDAPLYKGSSLSVASLAGCKLIFNKEGCCIRFNTTVLGTFRHSPEFLVVAYPKFIDKSNLRKHERYQVNIPIIFKSKDGSSNPGMIRDISLEGALITHALPLAKDDKIVVSAALKLGNMEDLVAVVKNIRKYVKGGETFNASGMEFLNPLPKNEHLLEKIVGYIKNQAKDLSFV